MDKRIEIELGIFSNESHVRAFKSILQSYAEDPMGGGEALDQAIVNKVVEDLKVLPTHVLVLAFVDGNAAGFANCFKGYSTFKAKPLINIHDFAVVPAYRGLGIAYGLLQKVEEIALEEGCAKLTLEVLENNLPAKNLYQKFGFEGYELNPAMGKAIFWQKNL